MRSIIENLYYGNIAPADRDVIKGGEYSKLMHLLTRNEEDLEGTLTQAQVEIFQQYKDCASELNDINDVTAFTLGFKIRMSLTVETMLDISSITEPQMT